MERPAFILKARVMRSIHEGELVQCRLDGRFIRGTMPFSTVDIISCLLYPWR